MNFALTGLVAATHTPFFADGSLRLDIVEPQAAHLLANRVSTAFIGGTTGECSSLTLPERQLLSERWLTVTRGTELRVVVHVGSNCLEDAKTLAAQAQKLGAAAVSAFAPAYFKPRDVGALVDSMAVVAGAAPATPFYYYEIPSMTGIRISPSEFLARAMERIPNLVGIKFSSNDLAEYQFCRALGDGRFDLPFGSDEILLSALALGAQGAVGSTYNFAAPIYHRLLAAFRRGDLATARHEQICGARLVERLADLGLMAAGKMIMEHLGVAVGPPRLPHIALNAEEHGRLQRELETLGFFDWIQG